MSGLNVVLVPCLKDNYVFLAHDRAQGATAVIDPAEAEPVLRAAQAKGWKISHILNTHHHADHVGGNLELKRATGAVIVGPAADRDRIPGIDLAVGDGQRVTLGASVATAMFVPGHTRGHFAYWFAEAKTLFCGDTLFALGCGRLFEGTAEQMWTSLERLRRLPDDTRVYCAHEYTQGNARFALSIEPYNPALISRARRIDEQRAAGEPTVPTTIGEERATNPFLRADDPVLAAAVGLPAAPPAAVFAEVRRRKDVF